MLSVNNILEIFAVASALGYVLLASKQHILCWPVSLLSCFIYAYLCYDSKLYMESALQIFYVFVSVYGWSQWKSNNKQLRVSLGSLRNNLLVIFLLGLLSLLIGYLVANYTSASLPYADTTVFVFSIYATFITAKKKLENWLYWIVIDAASVFIYINRELQLTAALFLLYTLLAANGYILWKKEWKQSVS